MKNISLLLIIIFAHLNLYAQDDKNIYSNGLRIDYGLATLGTGDLRGEVVGGVWSQKISRRINLEAGGLYINFPLSESNAIMQSTQGWTLEGTAKYHIVDQDRIQLFVGSGLYYKSLDFFFLTGEGVTFDFLGDLRVEENSTARITKNELGINIAFGAKVRIVEQYYININPVLQPTGNNVNSLRIGLEVRF